MKRILSLLILSSLVYASDYKGCADTKQNAKLALSGNIISNIQTDFKENTESKTSSDNEATNSKISSYTHITTNLSLVDITYKKKKWNEICAYVDSDKQIKNTEKILQKALLYKERNLPKDIDKKLEKLTLWLNDIQQLTHLMPVFLKDSVNYEKDLSMLNKKEKIFQDLYTDALAKSNSSVWKACDKTDEKAKIALGKLLFKHQGKKEKKSFWDAISDIANPLAWFKKGDKPLIELFNEQITYIKQNKKECAIIKKDDLRLITKNMTKDQLVFNKNTLEKNPTKKYKQLNNYIYHIHITNALMALFPNIYKKNDFDKINNYKKTLENIKKYTYPQFVQFNVIGNDTGKAIKIKLQNRSLKNKKKEYLKVGNYSYTISSANKCSIKDEFEIQQFKDLIISKDLSSSNYPTLLFISELQPNIVVNGKIIKNNIQTPIKQCNGKVRYVATFAEQTQSGEIELSPGATKSIELTFLKKKELAVFNDAKTKKFNATSSVKFSDSLTTITSNNLIFSLKDSPKNGEVSLDEKGSFTYTSNKDFIGTDTFSYTIKANSQNSGLKIVQISVELSKMDRLAQAKILAEEKAKKVKVKLEKVKKEKAEEQQANYKKRKKEKTEEKKNTHQEKSEEQQEERYQKFKYYVNSQKQNVEKLQKLQKAYPKLFKRLLKEKLGQ